MKLCTWFCHGLEMCTWFGYNPWINFCHFSTLWTLSFLTSDSMKVYRQWLPCKRNSLYNFMPVFMQLCTSFFSMVWRCACGLDSILQLIFVTFPLCYLCQFWQVRHQLHRSSIYFCRTCFSMGDLGVQVSVRSSFRPFVRPSTFTLGVLWAQLLLQFCTDRFETLHVFSSWYEDVHVVWI